MNQGLYPLSDGAELNLSNGFSTGFFAAIVKDKKVLLKQREKDSGEAPWDLPGGSLQDGELSPSVTLPRAVQFWTGLEVVSVCEQIGTAIPGVMAGRLDSAFLFLTVANGEPSTEGKLTKSVGYHDRESIKSIPMLPGPHDGVGRMTTMIYDALSIQEKPDVITMTELKAKHDSVTCIGQIALVKGGNLLYQVQTNGSVYMWPRLKPIIENGFVVGDTIYK